VINAVLDGNPLPIRKDEEIPPLSSLVPVQPEELDDVSSKEASPKRRHESEGDAPKRTHLASEAYPESVRSGGTRIRSGSSGSSGSVGSDGSSGTTRSGGIADSPEV